MAKFYGKTGWHPKLIIKQICLVQVSFYGVLLVVLGFLHLLMVTTDVGFKPLWDHKEISFDTAVGWSYSFGYWIAAAFASIALLVVVERSKKCLDFGFTLYFIHFLLVCCYSGIPNHWDWWITIFVSLFITVFLGEYLCARKELQDIPMYQILGGKKSNIDTTLPT